MDVLIDTNILVRGVHRKSVGHRDAIRALRILRSRADLVCVVPRNIYESRSVATRPVDTNGLGLSPSQAARITTRIGELCPVLRDLPELYYEWRRLVVDHGVSGKKSHDARLVAAMNVHGIRQIVTFNTDDFARYPGIGVIHPAKL